MPAGRRPVDPARHDSATGPVPFHRWYETRRLAMRVTPCTTATATRSCGPSKMRECTSPPSSRPRPAARKPGSSPRLWMAKAPRAELERAFLSSPCPVVPRGRAVDRPGRRCRHRRWLLLFTQTNGAQRAFLSRALSRAIAALPALAGVAAVSGFRLRVQRTTQDRSPRRRHV